MRIGLIVSFCLHVAILLAAFVVLPSADPFPAVAERVLPVELVTIDEFTNLMRAPTLEAEPEPVVEAEPEVQPEPEPAPAPEPPAPAVEPEAAPPAPLAPEPEPEPEPIVEEKKPEPKPKPVKKKSVKKAKPKNAFDPLSISALLDKQPDDVKRPSRSKLPAPAAAAGSNTEMTISEIDAFKVQMLRCWRLPSGAPEVGRLVVSLKVYLNIDGSLARPTEVVNKTGLIAGGSFLKVAKESALRAIKRCQPYTMPAEKYRSWRELDLTFDPRAMLGR